MRWSYLDASRFRTHWQMRYHPAITEAQFVSLPSVPLIFSSGESLLAKIQGSFQPKKFLYISMTHTFYVSGAKYDFLTEPVTAKCVANVSGEEITTVHGLELALARRITSTFSCSAIQQCSSLAILFGS